MIAKFRPSVSKSISGLCSALVLCCIFSETGGEFLIAQGETGRPANVVLIAGPITGHPKEAHEYKKAVTLIKHCLETSPNAPSMNLSAHYQGWPEDPSVLERADAILLVSDGSDHHETMHPFYREVRFAMLKKQMDRGCGLMLLHWSTFHPARFHDEITACLCGISL